MTKNWMKIVAFVVALCGVAQVSFAQYPGQQMPPSGGAPPGAAPSQPLPQGSFYQVSPSGQTFLMVPNSPVSPTGNVQMTSYSGGDGCAAGNCNSPSSGCGSKNCCCDKCCGIDGYEHCWSIYGGFMYLRARDSEVAWAATGNGPIVPNGSPVQVGPIAVLDSDYQPGFYAGISYVLDYCSSISATYSQYDSTTHNSIAGTPDNPVFSLIDHPSTDSGASTYLFGDARYLQNFRTLDIDYRQVLYGECGRKFTMVAGARLAQAEQRLDSTFSVLGVETVQTDVDFYGAGIRGGLEYEKISKRGIMFYGKAIASFVPGEYRANYLQKASFDDTVVDTGWTAGRLVTMVDLEIGIGWTNCCENFRVTAGYMVSSWYNTVQTDEWIHGVQTNNFIGMSSMSSYDGLMARAEFRF